MKKQTIILALALFGMFACFSLEAQNYKSALGVRAGYPMAVSYKTFVSGNNAIEIYGGFRNYRNYGWFSVNGAYLLHFDIDGVDGLLWYVGVGAGVQFWHYDNNFKDPDATNQSVSLQGYLGLDYKIPGAPLNLTLDWVPNIFVNGYSNGFYYRYGNLGVRYVLSE